MYLHWTQCALGHLSKLPYFEPSQNNMPIRAHAYNVINQKSEAYIYPTGYNFKWNTQNAQKHSNHKTIILNELILCLKQIKFCKIHASREVMAWKDVKHPLGISIDYCVIFAEYVPLYLYTYIDMQRDNYLYEYIYIYI